MNNNFQNSFEQKPLITFGAIADVQYCNCEPAGTRYYANSLDKLRKAISDLNNSNSDFIINLGDLIEKDYESYDKVMDIIGTSNKPVHHVLGNHDFSVRNRDKKKVSPLLTNDENYRSFLINNFRFILLNTCDLSTYGPSKSKARLANQLIDSLKLSYADNAFNWNGGLAKQQVEWFRNELKTASENDEKVLIFSHHTIVPEGPHNIFYRQAILDILSEYNNVISWFSGHNHLGAYGNFNNIHFVTLRGMVETPDENSFAIVEIYNNKIWIKGHGRENSQILAY